MVEDADIGRDSAKPVGVDGSKVSHPEEFARHLGLVSWLMTLSKDHRDLPMTFLEKRILPAILLKQFKLIMKNDMPGAFVSWASVSEDVQQKLVDPAEMLSLQDWRSGKNLVVIDCISPFAPAEKLKSDFLSRMRNEDRKH